MTETEQDICSECNGTGYIVVTCDQGHYGFTERCESCNKKGDGMTTETKEPQEVGLPLNQVMQFMQHLQGSLMIMQTDIGQALKSMEQIQQEAVEQLEEPVIAGKIEIEKENKENDND